VRQASALFMNLYKVFEAQDCAMVEINPLVETGDGRVLALDAKVSFDENAFYRHKNTWPELRDLDEEEPLEVEASKFGLNYIKLDGEVGCMVNGAGLAMATMDIIQLKGGKPANFLDVGGGATKERVAEALKIILSDDKVKGILVNIFGGIVRCDLIAEGIIAAVAEVNISVPIVVRLEGTKAVEGTAILNASDLNLIAAQDLGEAAVKIVAAVGEVK
jgi:succinyl-CoA synthetase beta subunit